MADTGETPSLEARLRAVRSDIAQIVGPHSAHWMVATLDSTAAELERLRSALEGLLIEAPTFRDYTGTDWETCAYCREPVEVERMHSHKPDCPWETARRALAGADTGEGR